MEINHDKCKIIVNEEGLTVLIYMYDKQIENVEYLNTSEECIRNPGTQKLKFV